MTVSGHIPPDFGVLALGQALFDGPQQNFAGLAAHRLRVRDRVDAKGDFGHNRTGRQATQPGQVRREIVHHHSGIQVAAQARSQIEAADRHRGGIRGRRIADIFHHKATDGARCAKADTATGGLGLRARDLFVLGQRMVFGHQQQQPPGSKPLYVEIKGRKRPGDKAKVDAPGPHGPELFLCVGHVDGELQTGNFVAGHLDRPRQAIVHQGRDDLNLKRAQGPVAQGIDSTLKADKAVFDVAAFNKKRIAIHGRMQPPLVECKERDPDGGFEISEVLADRRLRQLQLPRGGADAALFVHGTEDIKSLKGDRAHVQPIDKYDDSSK